MTTVTKRNGEREPLNLDKFHRVVAHACEGLTGVSASEVEMRSQLQFVDGIKTSDIQETLIKAAADLISVESPNYQLVAGRLINYHLRKQAYGKYEPPSLWDLYNDVSSAGYYSGELLNFYNRDEFVRLDAMIDHSRDELIGYSGMEQFRRKYLVQNRVTGQIFETPQFAYILIAATLFKDYPKEERLGWVKQYYDAISQHYISLPSPLVAGVRTPIKQFSSCVLIESDDSLDSISATSASIVKYVSQRAGIGIGYGRIRAKKSEIRNGATYHTGIVPFIKLQEAATSSCSQGSLRTGAATMFLPIWHYEIEDILVLKNNKGSEDARARRLDYGIQLCGLFYKRLIDGKNITLFSPHQVKDLYEAFFADQQKFEELYEHYERSRKVRKKTISAVDLFASLAQERIDTGRIYIMNVDHVNTHGSYDPSVAPIRQSNLCVEITAPTAPVTLRDISQPVVDVPFTAQDYSGNPFPQSEPIAPDGEISLCTLSAYNWGKFKSPQEFVKYGPLVVRALDALLDYQEYPLYPAKYWATRRRNIGIGIINFAYWMAKNGLRWTQFEDKDSEAIKELDKWTAWWSYSIIKASVDLAKERGACELSGDTKYSKGILPIDTAKEVTKRDFHLGEGDEHPPWEELRLELREHGIRNSNLMALMPSETSSQVAGGTNGVKPAQGMIVTKGSKDGALPQVVPEPRKLKNMYEVMWDLPSHKGYLNACAVLQAYIDQAISVETFYNPKNFENNMIPLNVVLGDLLEFYKYGGKNLYYNLINDGAGEVEVAEEDCESCKI